RTFLARLLSSPPLPPPCEIEPRLLWNRGSRAARIVHGPPRYRAIQTMAPGVASRRSFTGEQWTAVIITAMRHCEKRQITDETTLLDHRKLTWTGSLLV